MNWRPTLPRPVEVENVKINSVSEKLPNGKRPQLRPCRASWLTQRGEVEDTRFLIPAHPLFESAFCGFSRGTLVDTETGPVAIEDLLPGDRVLTDDGSAQQGTWIGTTTLVPTADHSDDRSVPLYRVLPDAFGMSRPLSHIVVGPSARILGRYAQALTPMSHFEDGVHIAALCPPSPVEMFHLCLKEHALIRMGGMAFESYHPGLGALRDVGPAMRDLFMKLFPHIESFPDFGLLSYPRTPDPIDGASAA